jgi:hypothetical protein
MECRTENTSKEPVWVNSHYRALSSRCIGMLSAHVSTSYFTQPYKV